MIIKKYNSLFLIIHFLDTCVRDSSLAFIGQAQIRADNGRLIVALYK